MAVLENLIVQYAHCGYCLKERPPHYSPMEWQDISVGLVKDKHHIQIWCNRHEMEVALLALAKQLDINNACECEHCT